MSDFQSRLDTFLAEIFALEPVFATGIGEHAHDALWPDRTPAGRDERLAFAERWLAEFGGLTDLSPDEAIDRDLVVGELEAARFADTELREDTWNPLEWVYLAGEGLFTLNAREFAPLADRLTSAAGRMEGLTGLFAAAEEALIGVPGRPVGASRPRPRCANCPGSTR